MFRTIVRYLSLLLLILGYACTIPKEIEFDIVLSGNNRATILPCGCKIPVGGLERKISFIAEFESPDIPLYKVECGNFLFSDYKVKQKERMIWNAIANLQSEYYGKAGFNVVNVGLFDLSFGLQYLRELSEKYTLNMLATNLLDSHGEAPFAKYIILENEGFKILVTGIIGHQVNHNKDYILTDPLTALRKVMQDQKGKYDFSIVIIDGNTELQKDIDSKISGIDLLVDTFSSRQSFSTKKLNHSKSISLGMEGKYLGLLNVSLHRSVRAKDLTAVRKRLEFAEKRISSYEKDVEEGSSIEEYYADRPSVLRSIDRYKKDIDTQKSVIDSTTSFYTWDVISLGEKIEKIPEIENKINTIRREFSKKGQSLPKPLYRAINPG